jgi:gamma-glutamyltranspeptidase/glutathione hydrolase
MLAAYAPETAAIEQRVLGMGGSCRVRLSPEFGAAAAGKLDELLDARPGRESAHHSASVVVVDRWGNVAALVHSSNTPLWGDTGLIVGGVPIPTPAGIFQHQMAGLPPGGRVPSEIAPVIALRDGKPVLAAAGIGVSMMPETVRLVSRLLGGDDPAAVLGEPAMLSPFAELDLNGAREELIPAGGYPTPFLDAVRRAGGAVREVDAGRTMALRGTVALGLMGTVKRKAVEVPGVLVFGDAY